MHDAAGDLAFDHRGVDDRPAVMRGDVTEDLHAAGLDIDLDDGDMAAVGVGRALGREILRVLQPDRYAGRHREAGHAIGEGGDLAQRLADLGHALDEDAAVAEV